MNSTRKFSSTIQLDHNSFDRNYNTTNASTFDPNYNPKIVPKFWNGVLPHTVDFSKFTIDCQGAIGAETDEVMQKKMEEAFAKEGIVYLTNTGVTKMADLQKYIDFLMKEEASEYTGGGNDRGRLEPYFYETGAPRQAHIHYHHEMTYVGKSIDKISFSCVDTIGDGLRGATFLSECVGMTEEIMKTELGHKLKEKGLCYWRNLTDREGVYTSDEEGQVWNHWQQSFGTEDPAEAQRLAEERRLQVEWGVDWAGNSRFMKTKYYASAFEYAPRLDMNIIYSNIADHFSWFDEWPGVNKLRPEDRPIKMTFGDDSDISWDEWRLWTKLADDFGFPIEWKSGDCVVLCNYRFAHGRPAYDLRQGEKRELGVVLGPVFDRIGALPHKW